MYMKAFNIWKTGNKDSNNLINKIENSNGYSVGSNGEYENSGLNTNENTIEPGPNNIFMTKGEHGWYLASTSSCNNYSMRYVYGNNAFIGNGAGAEGGICPIVPLDQ